MRVVTDNKKTLEYVIYLLLVTLPIYRDSPLAIFFGAAGYSFLTVLSPFFFLLIVVIEQGKANFTKFEKKLLLLGAWIMMAGIVGTIQWLINGNAINTLGENLFVKDVKVFILFIAAPFYVYSIRCCSRRLTDNQIFKPIELCFWFLTVVCIIERQTIPYAFQELHFSGEIPYYRIRLLTTESSWTAPIIFVYFAISIFYSLKNRHKIETALNSICILILCYFTTSKTLLVFILLFFAIIIFFYWKRIDKRRMAVVLGVFAIFLLILVYFLPRIIESVRGDIINFTSTSTRLYTMLIAFVICMGYPFGLGGAYIGFFAKSLQKHINIFDYLPIRFNTSEIEAIYSKKTDEGVVTSAGFMQQGMYWGILGGIIWMCLIFSELRAIKKSRIKNSIILYSAILSFFLMSFICVDYNFEFWMLISLCGVICQRESASEWYSVGEKRNEKTFS